MAEPVQSLLRYLDASPTPFHAVQYSAGLLREAGFVPLDEADVWSLTPGTRAYVTRNGSSLIALRCGQRPPPESGFIAVGAHTDSPNLRLKPSPDLTRSGYRQLAVEVYGGVLLSTWLDRDLSLAGRLVVDGDQGPQTLLVDLERPLLRIPNLAIHLNRSVNTEGLVLNAQQHLAPVLGLASAPACLELLAEHVRRTGRACQPRDVLGFDLCLYDVARAAVAGADGEFIQSARLDNLASCIAGLQALIAAPAQHDATRICVLYDHEEVGSRSAQGAASPFLRQCLQRVTHDLAGPAAQAFARAMALSFFVSADMAHAVHPNYADRHEPSHSPVLGGGPVLKHNANQSYSTDGRGAARFAKLCRAVEVPLQQYVVRSDMPCGSTIGPITAAELGMCTVDVGSPLLSMHSIREMAACADAQAMAKVLTALFSP